MNARMYVCLYVCLYVYVYAYIRECISPYVYEDADAHFHTLARASFDADPFASEHMYKRIYIYIYIYIYIHTHTQEPVIAVHVRHGDKLKEANRLSITDYLRVVTPLAQVCHILGSHCKVCFGLESDAHMPK
jgi:hypothetical protein